MKPIIIQVSLIALLLAGCQTTPSTTNFFHKTGSTISDKQVAYDQCKIQSLKEIPQAIGTSITPGMSSPGTTYCNSYGPYGGIQCNTYGGYNIPPQIDNFDMNDGLRERFVNTCMAKKGYSIKIMPYCKDGESGYSALDPAPVLSKIHCIEKTSPRIQ